MTALRQEALQMVNDMPENLLAALVETIQNFKIKRLQKMKKNILLRRKNFKKFLIRT